MDLIYLDNNATTKVAPEVYEAMVPYLTDIYFNPSSMYEPAREASAAIANSRKTIARLLGLDDPSQIIFTSCATESNNTAIQGALKANPKRRHLITSAVEHPAVLEVCRQMEREGYRVTYVPVDREGNLDIEAFVKALDEDTALVTIMHANNETGVIFPIEKLSRIVKETDRDIVFHTDATQSVGKMPINLSENFRNVDLLSFSGHKIHAPKGVGALFVRKGTPIRPFMIGGHQEEGRRPGTENVAGIVALGRALELLLNSHREDEERIRHLRDRLEEELLERIPYLEVNGKGAPRLANTSNLSCHYIEGEGILYQLSAYGICASSGSACTSGSLQPSHVLRAMRVPFTAIHGSVRFSLSRYTTEEEIERVIEVFPEIVSKLRRLSPYWDTRTNRPRADAPSAVETRYENS